MTIIIAILMQKTYNYFHIYGKDDFAVDLKIILLDYQNNYIEYSNWLLECQHFLQYYSYLIPM